jgi:parallel beta-helix repeat protein
MKKINILLSGFIFLILISITVSTVSAAETTCNSCDDCTQKLNGSYQVVSLTTGILDSTNKTCINITAQNIVFDCQNHIIDGVDNSDTIGVYSNQNGTTVKNCFLTDWIWGIRLVSSYNSTILNNNASSNADGIRVDDSYENRIFNNTVSSNNFGIYLVHSSNNNLTGNVLFGNRYNLGFWTSGISHFYNFVDTSNTINGKPIYYLLDKRDAVYDEFTNAGMFMCVSCRNVTVRNLNMSKNQLGCSLINTTNSYIENISISSSDYGIFLQSSSNNTIYKTNTSNNIRGIQLSDSYKNTISNNNASNNADGINLVGSYENRIFDNTVSNNNDYGIYLHFSPNNNLTGNALFGNIYGLGFYFSQVSDFHNFIDTSNTVDGKPIYYLLEQSNKIYDGFTNAGMFMCISCRNVTVRNLDISSKNLLGCSLINTTNSRVENIYVSNNYIGVYSYSSFNNTIFNNTALNNVFGVYLYYSSNDSVLNNFVCSNSDYDIYNDESNDSGDENTCNTTYNWNDTGTTGCTYSCGGGGGNTPPVISLIYPTNGLTIYNNQSVNFQFIAVDGEQSTLSCSLYLDGVLNRTNSSVANNTVTTLTVNNIAYGIHTWYVSCNDGSGTNTSQTYTFTLYDVIAPVISSVVNTTTNNTAVIQWNTDEAANSTVNYGLTTALGNSRSNPSFVTAHLITLTGLTSNTSYYYNVTSCDYYNNCATAGTYIFRTQELVGSEVAECSSCDDCSQKLNGSYKEIRLVADIIDHNGTCIVFGANNVTFDCQGHTIDGNGASYGIYLNSKSENTVRNCIVKEFEYGIFVYYSSNNNEIVSNNAYNNQLGIYLSSSFGNMLNDNTLLNNSIGIYLDMYSHDNIINNNNASSNVNGGISLISSYSNTVSNNVFWSDYVGINMWSSYNNSISKNNVQNNSESGVYLDSSYNNTIFNNLFNNTNNFYFYFLGTIYQNFWNTSRQSGTRIYSAGNEIGGNYWTNPSGNGYSDNCTDANKDGFCDNAYVLNQTENSSNIDYLPLSNKYSGPYCGDGSCNGGETCSSCPQDCGSCSGGPGPGPSGPSGGPSGYSPPKANCTGNETKPCGSNVGLCEAGVRYCSKGIWGDCIGGLGPINEICNGIDDDCNGFIDDGIICECNASDTRPCGSNVGICEQGLRACENGAWGTCVGGVNPNEQEICDNSLDDNCNGEVDESDCIRVGLDVGICTGGKIPSEGCKCGENVYTSGYCYGSIYTTEPIELPKLPWQEMIISGIVMLMIGLLLYNRRETVVSKVKGSVGLNKKVKGNDVALKIKNNTGRVLKDITVYDSVSKGNFLSSKILPNIETFVNIDNLKWIFMELEPKEEIVISYTTKTPSDLKGFVVWVEGKEYNFSKKKK